MKGLENKMKSIMKKSLSISGIILAMVLLINALPTGGANRVVFEVGRTYGVYASVAENESVSCFDEALWRAITNVADIEAELPSNLITLEVEIRPTKHVPVPLRMVFTREALRWLKKGKLTPDRFLREYVRFI
ncbi:MAG: hypothetical protein JSU77_04795 [Fidelibacterota bacterium]|nr:MAG: hypothetical protein JSU77_04795 [Candidatus Neomarinimicrobiota bacterium]